MAFVSTEEITNIRLHMFAGLSRKSPRFIGKGFSVWLIHYDVGPNQISTDTHLENLSKCAQKFHKTEGILLPFLCSSSNIF